MPHDDRAAPGGKADAEEREERSHRTFVNLVVAAFLLALAIAIIWVVKSLNEQRKLQDCLNSGRRNCVELSQGGPRSPWPAGQAGWLIARDGAHRTIDFAEPAPV
jgi:hypothetical protein